MSPREIEEKLAGYVSLVELDGYMTRYAETARRIRDGGGTQAVAVVLEQVVRDLEVASGRREVPTEDEPAPITVRTGGAP